MRKPTFKEYIVEEHEQQKIQERRTQNRKRREEHMCSYPKCDKTLRLLHPDQSPVGQRAYCPIHDRHALSDDELQIIMNQQ